MTLTDSAQGQVRMTRSTNMEHSEWVLVPKDAIERAIETLENDGDEHGEGRNLRAMLDAAPQPPAEAQPCGCGEATCTVPWEPGCGLGKSEQHVIVEGLRLADQFFDGDDNHWQWDDGEAFPASKVRTAYQAALAQQPASDGGFTAADMMDARQEGRKEAQQLAAVDGAMSPQVARELLLGLMGDYDFTLPSDAFSAIVDAIAAQPGGSDNDP